MLHISTQKQKFTQTFLKASVFFNNATSDHAHGMTHCDHNGYSHLPHNDHVLFWDNHDGAHHDRGNEAHHPRRHRT